MRQLLVSLILLTIHTSAWSSWIPNEPGYCPIPETVFAYRDAIVFNELGVFYETEDEVQSPFMMVDGELSALLFHGEEQTLLKVKFLKKHTQVRVILDVDGSTFDFPCFFGPVPQ